MALPCIVLVDMEDHRRISPIQAVILQTWCMSVSMTAKRILHLGHESFWVHLAIRVVAIDKHQLSGFGKFLFM